VYNAQPARSGCRAGGFLLATRRPLVVLNPAIPDATIGQDVSALRPAAVLADPEDWRRAAVSSAVCDAGALGVQVDFATEDDQAVQVIVKRTPGADHARSTKA